MSVEQSFANAGETDVDIVAMANIEPRIAVLMTKNSFALNVFDVLSLFDLIKSTIRIEYNLSAFSILGK